MQDLSSSHDFLPSYHGNSNSLKIQPKGLPPPYQPNGYTVQLNCEPPPPYCSKEFDIASTKTKSTTAAADEQSTTNVTMARVSQPRTSATTLNATPGAGNINGDYYMTLSVILTVLCLFSCGFFWLLCTIPAFLLSSKAVQANMVGHQNKAQQYGRFSLGLNAFAVVTWILFWAVVVICASSIHSPSSSSRHNYYSYYHSYNYYYK